MAHSIIVEKLSKQYQLGQLRHENMLRDALVNFVRHPFRKKQIETIWALKDVSFVIDPGEIFGIIGRNGAGKSTLLKVLARITCPTSGTLKILGRVASLLEVGTGFHEELTGRENIYLNGSILGMTRKEIRTKLEEIIAFSGVERFIDTPIKRYSSGMRLRLGFAVAAHLNVDVLLIDEVLAVGDVEFQKKCLKTMDNLSNSGRTVLFVSHNMEAIENICNRIIWVDNGQVRQDGDSGQVIKNYLSSFIDTQITGPDLSHIENRGGDGQIRYTRIEFLDSDRQPKDLIRSGDSLVVRLYYHAKRHIQTPHFALELFTEHGTKVTSFNTWSSGFEVPSLPPGDGYIDLEVGALNIFAARYHVSLWLASAGNTWYDRIDNCRVLEVKASDFYQSGRKMTSQHFGIAIFPCNWKLNGVQR
jgi:lipopolysaccharide transport system ATP-binding protein